MQYAAGNKFTRTLCATKHLQMTDTPPDVQELHRRIHQDIVDNLDEDLELEYEDRDVLDESERLKMPDAAEHAARKIYFKELFRLQSELVKLQDWVVAKKEKVVIVFEGRDSAGKGGAIKRISQRLNPRICHIAALPAPSERERTQWYFQRFIAHLPAGGEIVLFDRSWYNRAGVERVMGFCTPEQLEEFFRSVTEFEKMLVRSGIRLFKYWFSISDAEQEYRFLCRIHDPMKQWKLSPMDLDSRRRWEDYTKAKEDMLYRTHIPEAPWSVVNADNKKKARLNMIHHLLSKIPYTEVERPTIELPPRVHHPDYVRHPVPQDLMVPEIF